jgi:hypothetical protein
MQLSICGSYADATDRAVFSAAVNKKIVVQAKKYQGNVPNSAIQEIVAAKYHYNAEKAIVVTDSSFTPSATELALSNSVELWDGEKLRGIIKNLENNKKEKEIDVKREYSINMRKNTQTIKAVCPVCEKEFDYEITAKEIKDGFHTFCPNCGTTISAKIDSEDLN